MDWKNKPNQIFNKVKQQMFAKGVESFFYVDQFIRQYDPQFTGLLHPHFFNLFLNKAGVFLTTQQIRNIKDIYIKPNQQNISYMDFLQDVKYSIPETITNMLNYAYQKLDPNNIGYVSLDKITQNYRGKFHPHVITRRKTVEQVYGNFVNGITRKSDKDNKVNKQGFIDYYAQLNFCIPNQRENFFIELLKGTWGITHPDQYVKPQRLKEIQLILYQKIRQKSDGKTNQWKTAKKVLHFFDLGDTGVCDFQNFKRALDKFGCNFKNNQTKALFDKFDTNNSGVLEYQQFSKIVMDMDINGMSSKPNLLMTLGTTHFKVTH